MVFGWKSNELKIFKGPEINYYIEIHFSIYFTVPYKTMFSTVNKITRLPHILMVMNGVEEKSLKYNKNGIFRLLKMPNVMAKIVNFLVITKSK